jgi:glycosyltransferase involved in cell wall biosynthesis
MSTPFPPEEGIGNYVYNLSKYIINKGHKVTILTRSPSVKNNSDCIDGIDVVYVPFIPLYPFYVHIHGKILNLIFKKLESNFDVVHIHSPLSPCIKTTLPIVATVHTPMLTDTRSIEVVTLQSIIQILMAKLVSYPIEIKLIKRANVLTTVSHSVVNELKEYGVDPNSIEVIGNGVDETLFTPIKKRSGDRYILYTGRLAYRKGLFDLIECSQYIFRECPDVHFVITGKGPILNKLKKAIMKRGYEDRFRFLGYVSRERLIEVYQNATIFLLPSHYEGLPTVLLEAMSCGLPVVATAVSGTLDVISNGENGILIPPKNPKFMANAILTLLDDGQLRRQLGVAARKTIEERYTWKLISEKILRCYELSQGESIL